MYKQLTFIIAFIILNIDFSQAQIDGDNIFDDDQIITIELNFSQTSFWDSLTYNYDSATYMKADLTLTDITGTYSFNDVGVRLKGNSSYSHPGNKKSFKIDFNKYISGQNYDGLKKLNFSNGFKDPTLMREKLFFDVCQVANVPAPRASFANVYFNGALWGFYTVIEQIDDQFLDWRILDDDGNLFKAGDNFGGGPGGGGGNEADLVYYGTAQSAYEERYELKSNEEENDWSDLIALTDFINNSTPGDFESNLANHIELEEYLRSAALDNLFSNLDSYTQSARNYYIYHNLSTNKWEWIKWDGNEAFGTYGGGGGPGGGGGGGLNMTTLAIDYHSNNRPLLENIFNSEQLHAQYESEMCALVENYFNPEYMNPKIDGIKVLIQSSVYADNNKMYSNNNFDSNVENNISLGGGGPMGGTVYGLKSFVQQKNAYVTGQLQCPIPSGVVQIQPISVSLAPNPFTESVVLEFEKAEVHRMTIYNCLGTKVYEQSIEGQVRVEPDLSFLEKGVYFIRFNGKDIALKLIKL